MRAREGDDEVATAGSGWLKVRPVTLLSTINDPLANQSTSHLTPGHTIELTLPTAMKEEEEEHAPGSKTGLVTITHCC